MALWAREIMVLANDFCLNTKQVREIIASVNEMPTPQDKDENSYKYERAYSRIKPLIMNV